MSASNQQNLADSGANERPPMLKKGNCIPWESRFRRFLDNKLEEEERMWRSIKKGPYVRPMIPDPDNTSQQIIEPLSKMTEINRKNAGRQNRNQVFNVGNGLTQNDESHYSRDCQKPRVRDAKYFREEMLLAMKDEAGSNLKDKENDFMLDNSYGDETLEELTTAVIMMARIQPTDDNVVVNASHNLNSKEIYLVSGLGYQNPERVKKAIAAQPKMYHGEMLQSTNLKIDSPDSEETLEDAKESRLKMRNKMIQLDYGIKCSL
ncbi:hypothetical protein Tco_0505556 [Tanacetum coccineum]